MGFIVAFFAEKYYIPRISILPNVGAVFFLFAPYWTIINIYIKYWMYIGIIIGIVAIIYLKNKKSLPGVIYDLTYPFYSGKTIMGLYTTTLIFKELAIERLFTIEYYIIAIFLIILIWNMGIQYFGNDSPFKKWIN